MGFEKTCVENHPHAIRMRKKLPKSIRKHIRREKARIRREILSFEEQKKLIHDLYARFSTRGLSGERPSKEEIVKEVRKEVKTKGRTKQKKEVAKTKKKMAISSSLSPKKPPVKPKGRSTEP